MYAVIKTGGKQYKVAVGDQIKVEQLSIPVGDEFQIHDVMAVKTVDSFLIGTPLVSGITVLAKVIAHGRHDKVHIFKMRRRKHYQKRQGHRQNFTEIQIAAVNS